MQVDSEECWCRRLNEYERTLTLLLESWSDEETWAEETFIRDFQMLTAIVRNLRDVLNYRTSRGEFAVEGREAAMSLCTTEKKS